VVFRHGPQQGAHLPFDRVVIELFSIGQDRGDALDPGIRDVHQRPKGGGVF
jgi:hypothetical protein